VEVGAVDDIFYRPRMPYSMGLLGSLPRLDSSSKQRLTPIAGAPPSPVNLPTGCPFTPRCPLAQDICEENEPGLAITDGPAHLAACHFHDELVGMNARQVFGTTSADPDLIDPADTEVLR
jgi:oligopeptide/dipeptide ABC transporter ATP-binding protein